MTRAWALGLIVLLIYSLVALVWPLVGGLLLFIWVTDALMIWRDERDHDRL